ncbi:hypothetical protein GG344DRAFT_74303 [Lentinula edodes]|nr:hypothetical protein GG344DRAFT_74303 [Lentinula edodes]
MPPSKKRKGAASAPRPTTVALGQTPSDLLTQMLKLTSPEALVKVLERTLYPTLDTLPAKPRSDIVEVLQKALKDTERVHELRTTIEYETRRKSLESQIKNLEKDAKRNWKHGYEEQGEMMSEIATEVLEWLPDLWRIGVEEGIEIPAIQRCLSLCTTIIRRIENCGSRAEFSDMDFELTIEDSDGQTVYKHRYQPVSDTVAWMWRELWISASASQSPFEAGILDDVESLNLKDSVLGLIRTGNLVEQEEGDEDDDEYQDAHWTPSMRAAASRVLDARHAARLVEFNTNLSTAVYNTLLQESPKIKPMLLDTLRKHVFGAQTSKFSSNVYRSAAEIFAKDSPDDLPKLHDALPSWEKSSDIMQLFVKHFSTQESSTLREKGLQIIEQGFCDARSSVMSEIEDTFPGFDEAYDWLEERVSEGKISKKEPQQRFGPEARKRDAFIDKFEDIAIRNRYGDSYREEFGYWDDRDVGVDSDDSDYEEQMDIRQPDMSRPFLIWATALCEWPDKEEAQKLWERMNSSGDDDNLLFSVEGVADSLAGKCDYDYNHNGAKQYVSDGIKAMYNVLRCPDLKALERYQMKTTSSYGGITFTSIPTF